MRANSCTWSDQKKVLFGNTVTSYHPGAVQQLNLIFHRFVIKTQLPLYHMRVVLLHSYNIFLLSTNLTCQYNCINLPFKVLPETF